MEINQDYDVDITGGKTSRNTQKHSSTTYTGGFKKCIHDLFADNWHALFFSPGFTNLK